MIFTFEMPSTPRGGDVTLPRQQQEPFRMTAKLDSSAPGTVPMRIARA